MRPGQGIFSGRLEDLDNLLAEHKLGIPMDSEVELVIKPVPGLEGFEKIFKPKVYSIPGHGKGDSDDDVEEKPSSEQKENQDKDEETPIWFSRKLKSILRDNAIQRHSGNKRSGDLDMKHLYKAATTGKCFTDKDVISNKQYSIALVVDCSGSMNGEPARLAGACASKFVEQFQKLTALSVILFNSKTEICKMPNKTFGQKELTWLKNKIIVKSGSNDGYGNHDSYAISKAEEILRPQKGRKIIVVMSDAEPACGSSRCDNRDRKHECFKSNARDETRETIRKIKAKNYSVLGLGMFQFSYPDLYPDGIIVKNLKEMYPNLIKLLQIAVKRGGV